VECFRRCGKLCDEGGKIHEERTVSNPQKTNPKNNNNQKKKNKLLPGTQQSEAEQRERGERDRSPPEMKKLQREKDG